MLISYEDVVSAAHDLTEAERRALLQSLRATLDDEYPPPEPPPRKRPLLALTAAALVSVGVVLATGTMLCEKTVVRPIATLEPQEPRKPKTGTITLESIPGGAEIHLNGVPMALSNGKIAKTPSDLHSLKLGKGYLITLHKPGYETAEVRVRLFSDSWTNAKKIKLRKLTPERSRGDVLEDLK